MAKTRNSYIGDITSRRTRSIRDATGLIDWLRGTMLVNGTISEEDFEFIRITDDINEVVSIMIEHREWKKSKRYHEDDGWIDKE